MASKSNPVKLTSLASCAGCAAKLNPEKLAHLLQPIQDIFQAEDYPDLLQGLQEPDDAAVWKLDEEKALVVTTDFFTPVVDDAYDFGSIAAANALSDIYAMGAKPFLALNILGFPNDLDIEIASDILRGGGEKAKEAGVVVAGGHTIQDPEPKFGLIALGMLEQEKVISKNGARPGDRLFLSKPLGFGVTNTATKRGLTSAEEQNEVVEWMAKLNNDISTLALEIGIRVGTDVTGFGFLGHAWEMAKGAKVEFQISFAELPFTRSAKKFAQQFTFPGGSIDNREYFQPQVQFEGALSEGEQMLLFDAQTSGGLLLAVESDSADDFSARAKKEKIPLWEIGEIKQGSAKIRVV